MGDAALIALPEGSIFHGRYRVVRGIKTGGMGAVYEVVHIETRRRRALKLMLPSLVADPDLRARFKLEATVTADVDSEHLVETFDAGVDAATGAPFLVMELLRGEDLDAALKRRGRLPAPEVVTLLKQAALALDRVHAVGIVHRDLKPDNLFVTKRDDGSPRLKVLDFGIAKLVAQSSLSARTTRSLGSPVYMSPEQIRGDGDIGPHADLYSLGQIAYALLTGGAYWDAEARGAAAIYPLLVKMMHGAPEPATARAAAAGVALPAAFDAWFARATAPAPEDRFETAPELVEALAAALQDAEIPPPAMRPVTARAADIPDGARKRPRRSLIAAALVAAGLIAIAGVVWTSRPQPPAAIGAAPADAPSISAFTAPDASATPPGGEVSTASAAPVDRDPPRASPSSSSFHW